MQQYHDYKCALLTGNSITVNANKLKKAQFDCKYSGYFSSKYANMPVQECVGIDEDEDVNSEHVQSYTRLQLVIDNLDGGP